MKLNSNSLECRQVLKLATQLLSPEIIRTLVFRIIKVFEDISQVELSKGRWEEIKKLQPSFTSMI
ncbi:hypothetical protein A3G16_05330 [Candidatus Curtissbacteria bacterium RIFCSPLOWO2_12_FULL_41_16]|nr:MAG: hypothetical protein A3G16_05330 [Candidatus Curtissbacteria bacterium RIFCSPLOWO2_12_FULL_41_16]